MIQNLSISRIVFLAKRTVFALTVVLLGIRLVFLPTELRDTIIAAWPVFVSLAGIFLLVFSQTDFQRVANSNLATIVMIIIALLLLFARLPIASMPMPFGQYNVAVAGFAYQRADGTIEKSSVTDSISDAVFDQLKDLPLIDNLRGPSDGGVETITSATPDLRAARAMQIADELNAVVLVYGIVRENGPYEVIEPKFYISDVYSYIEPELVGHIGLGEPIPILSGGISVGQNTIETRLSVLRDVLEGIGLYVNGDYDEAVDTFTRAIHDHPEIELLPILAGNSAVRAGQSDIALEYYNQALELRPNYPRALIGRGIVLFQLAQAQNSGFDTQQSLPASLTCNKTAQPIPDEPQMLALLSINCYEQALAAVEVASLNRVEIKARWGLGQVYGWLCIQGADTCTQADEHLEYVTHTYEAADRDTRNTLLFYAGHAYAWRGGIILTSPYTLETVLLARDYYKEAIQILEEDIERNYGEKSIDLYRERVQLLDIWIEDNQT